MDTTRVAYVLCRIEDDASLTPVRSTRMSCWCGGRQA